MHKDALHHRGKLTEQAAGVVVQAIPLTQGLNLRRDLDITVRWHVGEKMVLDLVAQMPGHDVKQAAAFQIA